MNYMNDTTVIHLLQKNLLFLVICCWGIVKKIADKYQIKVGNVKKLIPNLGNKTKYVLHYKTLQLYLSLGMKLTEIHRAL